MPITTIDDATALIVVDLQKGVVDLPTLHPMVDIVARARALADAIRQHRLPVALVTVTGGAPGRTEQPSRQATLPDGFGDSLPELNQHPGDIVVTERTWGAFTRTDLESELKTGVSRRWSLPGCRPAPTWNPPPGRPMRWIFTSRWPSMP